MARVRLYCALGMLASKAFAFLEQEMPLRVLSVLPGNSGEEATRLYGRTALTVVFSRAVIALGADWSDEGNDGQLPPELVPFTLEACTGQPVFAVPGKIRWSTTAIARFDAGIDWPTDLCFDLVLNPSLQSFDGLALSTSNISARRRFETGSVTMSMSRVRSKLASEFTGGRWTSELLGEAKMDSGTHECPSDCVAHLVFSYDLDHGSAFAALQSENSALLAADGSYESCGRRCLAVQPRGLQPGVQYTLAFPRGGRYSKVAGAAGVEQRVSLTGLVPFKFAFWFETPPRESWRNQKLQYRRHRVYLRHGLDTAAGEEDALTKLRTAIQLTDRSGRPLDFNLSRPEPATLQLECASLQPERRYSLQVQASAEVRDGFGQPLQQSGMEYDTGDWPRAFVQAEGWPARFRELSSGWKVLARGENNRYQDSGAYRPYEVSAWPVLPRDLHSALVQRFNVNEPAPSDAVAVRAPLTNELQVLSLDSERLLASNRSGLFLRQLRTSSWAPQSRAFVSVAPFGAAFVATESDELLVWATTYGSGLPVQGAAVSVYRLERNYNVEPDDVVLVASGTTGVDGTVTLVPSDGRSWRNPARPWSTTLVGAVVTTGGDIALSEQVPIPEAAASPPMRATLVTDRSIYRPGEPVYLKGYIRSLNNNGTSYSLPGTDIGSLALQVQWKRMSGGGKAEAENAVQRVETPLLTAFGTVSGELRVPENEDDVTFGDISVNLMRTSAGREESVAAAVITVADPRPPTVELSLTTTGQVVLPGPAAALELEMRASTYTGTGVKGAEVTLTWTLTRGGTGSSSSLEMTGLHGMVRPVPSRRLDIMERSAVSQPGGTGAGATATGQLTAVTGDDGVATVTLALAELLETAGEDGGPVEPCAEGDSLAVSARWVGPTREVVTAELEGGAVRVARSPYVLSIKPAQPVDALSGRPLPGTPFAVFVDMRDGNGTSVTATKVALSLHEWDGEAPITEDPFANLPSTANEAAVLAAATQSGLLPTHSWGTQVGAPCNATADGGATAQCGSTLMLPSAKKYVVLAKASGPEGVELVVAFPVGKTPAEWTARPLASMEPSLVVQPDKASYVVGETASLTFVSPFQDASALVLWGNGAARRSKQQGLGGAPGQQHSIDVEVGEGCRFGCSVLVLLVAPEQPRAAVLPVEVPVSPLLDVSSPRSLSASVRLEVPDADRAFAAGAVGVSVAASGAEAAVDVLEPGAKAKVRVKAEEGSEVCVFVVDKAMLDIGGASRPHPVVELDRHFRLEHSEAFKVEDTRGGLASFAGYLETVAAAVRRATLDPFAYDPWWPLIPDGHSQAPVEQTDADYLAGKTADATKFPPSGRTWLDDAPEWEEEAVADGGYMASPPEPSMDGVASLDGAADEEMRGAFPEDGSTKSAASGGTNSAELGGTALGKEAYTRSAFVTTPLFAASVVVGSDGTATVPLTMPDNIATFEVRAYVVDGNAAHRFGQATASVVSRRSVSMVPSVPRVVRPGDRFECGVSVTGHLPSGMPAQGVKVLAEAAGGSTGLGLQEGSGQRLLNGSAGSGPHEITFPFSIPLAITGGGIGSAGVTFTAHLQGSSEDVIDALELPLLVKAPQGVVHVATSMAITASGDEATPWAEGIDLPRAMPGSGQLELTAGVGHLPSVVLNGAYVAQGRMNNGQSLACACLPAVSLGLYYAPGSAVPGKAAAAAGLDTVAEVCNRAIATLPAYTDNSGYYPLGLMWRPSDSSFSWSTPRASVSLNTFGIFAAQVADALAPLFPQAAGGVVASGAWALLDIDLPASLVSNWKTALQRELERQVQELRSGSFGLRCSSDCYRSWETLAEVRAAVGFQWNPSQADARQELSMQRLFSEEALALLGPGGLARAALAYVLHAPPSSLPAEGVARLDAVYSRLAGLVRVQGRTAYLAASPGSAHSAGLEANAVALLLLARAGADARAQHFAGDAGASLAAKLAAYVADGGGGGRSVRFGGGLWVSERAASLAALALAAYDAAHGSTQPDLELTASSGEVEILAYEARGAAAPPTAASVAWEELAQPPSPVEFLATGQGQVSVVAALAFVPAAVPMLGAIYRGIFVEKAIQLMDTATGLATGPPIQVIPLGASVVVTIQVTTPDDVARVTVEDLSAGGLEPVDPKVLGDDAGSGVSDGCGSSSGWWSWWCVPAFYHRETYADRVMWTSWSMLQAGTHTMSYQAVAATRGAFTLPPAQASVDEQPEIMGLSRAGTVIVAEETATATAAVALPDPKDEAAVVAYLEVHKVSRMTSALPKACPGGCPNGGVCQLDLGTCACYQGVQLVDGDCPDDAELIGGEEPTRPGDAEPIGGEEPTRSPARSPADTNEPTSSGSSLLPGIPSEAWPFAAWQMPVVLGVAVAAAAPQ